MPIIGRINTENGAIKNARREDNLHDSEFYPEGVAILINCCSKPFFSFYQSERNETGVGAEWEQGAKAGGQNSDEWTEG